MAVNAAYAPARAASVSRWTKALSSPLRAVTASRHWSRISVALSSPARTASATSTTVRTGGHTNFAGMSEPGSDAFLADPQNPALNSATMMLVGDESRPPPLAWNTLRPLPLLQPDDWG